MKYKPRDKTEIEETERHLEVACELNKKLHTEIERLQKEAERWKNAMMGECMLSACPNKEQLKSEAYREFADKLHDNFISKVQKHYCRINAEHSYKWTEGYTSDAVLSSICDTLKELTEGGK